jgi:hypothetical protein
VSETDADEVHLGLGDPAGELDELGVGALARDLPRPALERKRGKTVQPS